MKTICPPGYHHNGFVATHAPGHMSCPYIMSPGKPYIMCPGA